MKKTKSSKVSLGDVAKAAGVSKTTACDALRNHPSASKATSKRVQRIAKRLGYAPDARMAILMAGVRGGKAKDLLPIAWLNSNAEKDTFQKYKAAVPYLLGAQERSLQLGYRIEEIWIRQPCMTMRRLSQIIHQRGIEGVIVPGPAKHIRLDWDHLAGVSLDGYLLAPSLHGVMSDINFNLLLALKSLRRLGYRRIGVCFSDLSDRFFHHLVPALSHYFHSTIPKSEQVPPLFYAGNVSMTEKQITAWLRRHQPDVVVGHSSELLPWVKAAGYRVPEDIGVVHMATDDDVSDWAGICSNRRAVGATAVELAISLIRNRQFGVPKTPVHSLVRGSWHPGRTLLIPRIKPDVRKHSSC